MYVKLAILPLGKVGQEKPSVELMFSIHEMGGVYRGSAGEPGLDSINIIIIYAPWLIGRKFLDL